jgi:hypothetical protein
MALLRQLNGDCLPGLLPRPQKRALSFCFILRLAENRFTLFQAHATGKRCAGAGGHARAPKKGCPQLSGLVRDRSRESPTDCSAESARQRASSRSKRRSDRWLQAHIGSRSAGDGSAGRVSAKWCSGKYRLAPWPRSLGNSPFGATVPGIQRRRLCRIWSFTRTARVLTVPSPLELVRFGWHQKRALSFCFSCVSIGKPLRTFPDAL